MPGGSTEHRKLAAIMFTDMVGYSALSQRNEALALELLEEHRHLLRALFPQFNGAEIKTIGDAFLVEFHSALEAAQCGIEIQRALAKRNHDVPAERRIELKIGIHIGDVVHRGGDVYGDGVNIASRIEPLAGAGGICVSMDVERQIRNALEARFERLGARELKNIAAPMELFRIVLPWEQFGSSRRQEAHPFKSAVRSPHSAIEKSLVTSAATRWGGIAALLFLAAAVGWWFWNRPGEPPGQDHNTPSGASARRIEWLAVLPFRNYSGDTNQDYFVDGMTGSLQNELAQISGLQVKSHTTAMQYKGTKKTVPEIAQELRVDAVLEGSIQRDINQLVISVQLIEAATDRGLWSQRYEREVTQVLRTQGEVVEAIARAVQVKLTPGEESKLAAARPVDPAAFDEYLKGQQHWYRFTPDGFARALQAFLKVISIDPNFAPAYAGVGSCYQAMANNEYLPPHIGFVKGREMHAKSLALEETHRAVLGQAGGKIFYEWDWPGAVERLARALALRPNDGLTHQLHSFYLTSRGEFDQAMVHAQRAVEVEPLVPIAQVSVARVYYYSGKYGEAVRSFRDVAGRFPRFPIGIAGLGLAYLQNGQPAEAIQTFERALAVDRLPRYLGGRGAALARSGRRQEAEQAAQELEALYRETSHGTERYTSPLHLAMVYAALDDKRQALEWLRRGFDEHAPQMYFLKVEPAFANLRTEEGFRELLRNMNLE
jgi:class 3 adenylate cyclase/TolB-like protein/Flp pilus assembly protein TadD